MSIFTSLERPDLAVTVQEFIDAQESTGAAPIYTMTPESARQMMIDNQNSVSIQKPDVEAHDITLDVGPTGHIQVRIIKPSGAKDKLPTILYLHGGGWVTGGKETHDRLIRELAVEVGAAVVFPEYGLAPDVKYPVPVEQSYAVLEHVGRNARELGLDPDGFVLAGDSAGGTLATVVAMLAKERGGPRVLYQVLFYPVTDAEMDTKSYKEFSDGPMLTKKAMKWFWDNYLPDTERRSERNASPLKARDEDLQVMPPALIITAENDVLRDEGEKYARRLDECGVKVACVRMKGTIHDFVMLNALAKTPQTRAAMALAVAEIKKAFQATFPESR